MRSARRSAVATTAPLVLLIGVGFAAADSSVAWAEPPAAQPSPNPPAAAAPTDEARMHFNAGVALLRDPGKPRYEEAYREFKSAYELSKNPKALGNIAFCAMKLERDAEAIAAYEQYIEQVPNLDATDRAQIERDLLTLRTGIAKVTVESDPPGAAIIDTRVPAQGEAITNFYGPVNGATVLSLRRGHHVLRARLVGHDDEVWELELDVASVEPHKFVLKESRSAENATDGEAAPNLLPPAPVADSPPRPVPKSVYAMGGVTVALGIAAAITGVAAINKRSDYNALNDGSNSALAGDARTNGLRFNIANDVLLTGAVVSAAVTAILFISRPAVADRKSIEARFRGVSLSF